MKLDTYKSKIDAGPDNLDALEKASILVLVFQILADAAEIIFPKGDYKEMKWYHIRRWGKLGQLMWRLVRMVYGKG